MTLRSGDGRVILKDDRMPRKVAAAAVRNSSRAVRAELRAPRALSVAEAMEQVRQDSSSDWKPWGRYVSVNGLAELTNSAKAEWRKVGIDLPWNLDGLTSSGFSNEIERRKGRWYAEWEASEIIGRHARFAGWLRTAVNLPVLRRLIEKTQSVNGVGSPHTHVDLWALSARWPSPGRLERVVKSVRRRGNAILMAYAGQPRVSYKGIALALMSERTAGKAAVVAVAVTLGLCDRYETPTYRRARQVLIDLHINYPIVRTDDGVTTRTGRVPTLIQGDVAVYAAKFTRPDRVSLHHQGWLVIAGDRSYHVNGDYGVGAGEALARALHAWARQDEERARLDVYAKTATELITELTGFLDGTLLGVCPLIRRQDSYRAGNCSLGTEEWVARRGWRRKTFVPGVALIPHLGDERVRWVVSTLKQEFASA
jgi:hypothetical protein